MNWLSIFLHTPYYLHLEDTLNLAQVPLYKSPGRPGMGPQRTFPQRPHHWAHFILRAWEYFARMLSCI